MGIGLRLWLREILCEKPCVPKYVFHDWSRIAVMPVEASASSSNVLYASVMLLAMYVRQLKFVCMLVLTVP
jgi:hypothetical protein